MMQNLNNGLTSKISSKILSLYEKIDDVWRELYASQCKNITEHITLFLRQYTQYSESKQGKCTGPSISTQLIAFSS